VHTRNDLADSAELHKKPPYLPVPDLSARGRNRSRHDLRNPPALPDDGRLATNDMAKGRHRNVTHTLITGEGNSYRDTTRVIVVNAKQARPAVSAPIRSLRRHCPRAKPQPA
jgi:hypothetical protein